MDSFYSSNKETMELLGAFLKSHEGKPLFVVCDDLNDEILDYEEISGNRQESPRVISLGDGRFGVVSERPVEISPEATGWRPSDSFYPSGFAFGDVVFLLAGKRKYNSHIEIPIGSLLTVVEPPNREGWPDDAVQVQFGSGCGAVDASLLRQAN